MFLANQIAFNYSRNPKTRSLSVTDDYGLASSGRIGITPFSINWFKNKNKFIHK